MVSELTDVPGQEKDMATLDVDNLGMTSEVLVCGYQAITPIWNGKPNPNLTPSDTERYLYTMSKMASECESDRLADNYTTNLNLSDQFLYTILWDTERSEPCMVTGAQMMGRCVRVYSRYYQFREYRVKNTGNPQTSDKSDNFEILLRHTEVCDQFFDYIFVSRDRGASAWRWFKRHRPDIFSDWHIIPEPVEVFYPGNYQGCMVRGITDHTDFQKAIRPD